MRNELNNAQVNINKFLSLALRYSPSAIHLNMDKNVWGNIQELIDNANKYKKMNLNVDIMSLRGVELRGSLAALYFNGDSFDRKFIIPSRERVLWFNTNLLQALRYLSRSKRS